MFIYKITNIITRKSYVGQTKRSIQKRFKAHIYESKKEVDDMYIHRSIRKYGEENFKIELIEECTFENIYEREKFWIKTLNTKSPNGYNQHDGGRGGCLNPSVELRAKLSSSKKGHIPWNKGISTKNFNKNIQKTQNYDNPVRSQKISNKQKERWVRWREHQNQTQPSTPIKLCLCCKKPHNNKKFCSQNCAAKLRGGWNHGLTKQIHPNLSGGAGYHKKNKWPVC